MRFMEWTGRPACMGAMLVTLVMLCGQSSAAMFLQQEPVVEDAIEINQADSSSSADSSNAGPDSEPTAEDRWVGCKAGDRKVVTIKGVEYAFRWCPAGTFQMGSPSGECDRQPDESLHRVTLTQGFWMQETEVTQEQWETIMGSNPSYFSPGGEGKDQVSGLDTKRFPVEMVSWENCQEYIRNLNMKIESSGMKFALPTEAEWEYACRAGTTGAYGGTGDPDEMGWYGENSSSMTHEVGSKKPNRWGLYDMHGNVLEWCADWCDWDASIKGLKTNTYRDGVKNPLCTTGVRRVVRGGGWDFAAAYWRSASRDYIVPSSRYYFLGLRPVVRPVQ